MLTGGHFTLAVSLGVQLGTALVQEGRALVQRSHWADLVRMQPVSRAASWRPARVFTASPRAGALLAASFASSAVTASGRPARPLRDVLTKNLQWAAAKLMGFALCVPLALTYALNTLRRPRQALARLPDVKLPDPLPDVLHEYVDVDGTRLHLARTCANAGGAKPVLVLLHGFPEGWFSWRHQMAAFRDEWCVVALSLRGYGGSDKPQDVGSYRMAHLVADVAGVIQAVAPPSSGRVVLAGHDWGGEVAWHVAHAHPELLDKLVVLSAPHPSRFLPNLDRDQARRSWYIAAFQTPWIPEAVLRWGAYDMVGRMLAGRTMGCKNHLPQEDVLRYKQHFAQPGTAKAAVNYYRAALDYSLCAWDPEMEKSLAHKLPMPVLLLWADGDVALGPQLLRGTEKHAERLTVRIVQDCSHWMQQDRWQEVNALLREFLAT